MSRTGVKRSRTAAARDVVVTGMGFCLPGDGEPVLTAGQLWDVAAQGRSCLRRDGVYYGSVDLPRETFDERVRSVAGHFSQHFTGAHRFGLLSLAVACEDAGLDLAARRRAAPHTAERGLRTARDGPQAWHASRACRSRQTRQRCCRGNR